MTGPVVANGREARRGGQGMLRAIVVIAALGPVLLLPESYTVIPAHVRLQSQLLWILCWLPAFVYVMSDAKRREPLPLLPVIGITHGLYYGLQVSIGVDNAQRLGMDELFIAPLDPRQDYEYPVQLALLGWVALLIAYYGAKAMLPPRPFTLPARVRTYALRTWAIRMLVGGLVMEVLRQALPVPPVLRGILNFAGAIAQFGMALLIVLQARGALERRHRLILGAGVSAIVLLAIGTGSIASAVFASLTAGLALWVGHERVRARWIVVAVIAGAVFVSLRGVAMDYRRIAWFTTEQLPVMQRSKVILAILAQRVDQTGVGATVLHGWDVVSTRSANLDLFADVVRRTPRHVPYWEGETYLSLVGLAVPRILWPNKPQKQLGQAFGHRYGYLGPNDRHTSVNLPYFIEFYCNFGAWGVLVGMFLVGVIYAALEQRLNTRSQGTLVSVCAIVLLVPLVNIESDFSLIFGGLFLNGVTLLTILHLMARAAQSKSAQERVPAFGQARIARS